MLMGILGGPTAIGKSAIGLKLCAQNGFALIAADSRQLYAELNIGTGAPTAQERAQVRHFLVNELPLGEAYSPLRFREDVLRILSSLGDTPSFIVGGTGLYLRELLFPTKSNVVNAPPDIAAAAQAKLDNDGAKALHAELTRLDPSSMSHVHVNDHFRLRKRLEHWMMTGEGYLERAPEPQRDPRFADVPLLLLDRPREELHDLIANRVKAMAKAGWPVEAQLLFARHMPDTLGLNAIGYTEMADVASGKLSIDEAIRHVIARTNQYAKRQSTFFRHQFPDAEKWDATEFHQALLSVDFDWQRFRASRRKTLNER